LDLNHNTLCLEGSAFAPSELIPMRPALPYLPPSLGDEEDTGTTPEPHMARDGSIFLCHFKTVGGGLWTGIRSYENCQH